MRESWATFGVDLHLERSGTRVRDGLERGLREAVRSGRLRPGARLPSSRALASDLGVARNTVAEAYSQLVAEGWLTAVPGSGTSVSERGQAATTATTPPTAPKDRPPFDLRPGSPDLGGFPRAAWAAAARKVLAVAPDEALGYGDTLGRPELRVALADYLARSRGLRVDPGQVVVCSGFASAVAVLAGVLTGRGGVRVAVEAYGQPAHRRVLAAGGLTVGTVPVDEHGARVGLLGNESAVLLTPAHQFPLGMALSRDRRLEVAAWAADTGGLVVEDDYDGEFRYDRQPVGALQGLAPGNVCYVGTASKSLAPGLRLSWLVVPHDVVAEVRSTRTPGDVTAGSLEQLTLAEFLVSGSYDRHVRRARLAYRRRRDRLVRALSAGAPGARVTGIAAGMHAVVELPAGVSEADVVARAGRLGLALEGLGDYFARPPVGRGRRQAAVVVGYGTPPEHAFAGALDRLLDALDASER